MNTQQQRSIVSTRHARRMWLPRITNVPMAILMLVALIVLAACAPSTNQSPRPTTAVTAASRATVTPSAQSQAAAPQTVDVTGYTFRVDATGYDLPAEIPSGIVPLTFAAGEATPAGVLVGRLHAEVSYADLQTAMEEGGPMAALGQMTLLGGAMLGPGQRFEATFDVKPGDYVVLDMAGVAPGVGTFQVRADQVSNLPVPQAQVVIDMMDFAYGIVDPLPAGRQMWEVVNSGQQWHEFTVTRLEDGTSAADFMALVQEMAQHDGPPAPDAFAFFWMPSGPGERAWVEVELEAGTYGLACLLPDLAVAADEHASHVDRGMVRLITVE